MCGLRSCSFFASQVLASDAHIVFCPYNYMLDPAISSALSINLAQSVVILDEAHNIEGVCRDAGSADTTAFSLVEASYLIQDFGRQARSEALCAASNRISTHLDPLIKAMLKAAGSRRRCQKVAEVESFGGGASGCVKFFGSFGFGELGALASAIDLINQDLQSGGIYPSEMNMLDVRAVTAARS